MTFRRAAVVLPSVRLTSAVVRTPPSVVTPAFSTAKESSFGVLDIWLM